ncbi:MAG: CCA tRNA nucleotidyltransferase [Myxococcaceae bacterium]
MTLPTPLAHAVIPGRVLVVLERLKERGHAAYLVGGCVRDLLLGKPATDFDVATSARPEEVQKAFDKVIPTGIQHGTVTVMWKGMGVEVTTFRKEGVYLDGRRPSEVVFHKDVEADLSRRDFTINAMAFDPVNKTLCDPFEGQKDLAARTLRCVGAAMDRFSEDGLRALRAVRFAAVLGFSLEQSTFDAISRTLDVFAKVAAERVKDELSKLLLSDRPVLGLSLLRDSGLLARILPEFDDRPGFNAVGECEADLELRLAALLQDTPNARDICLRLKLPTKTVERVALLVRLQDAARVSQASDADVRRFVAELGLENVATWLALTEANDRAAEKNPDVAASRRKKLSTILESKPALFPRDLALNGAAIMRVLQVGPSPLIGQASRFLMEQVFEDPSLNQADRLEALLATWKAAQKS